MRRVIDAGTRQGRNFAPERTEAEANVFDAVTKHVHALQTAGKRVVIAMWSEGSRERMSHVLADHGLANLTNVADYPDVLRRPNAEIALAVLGLETGFETDDLAVIGEQDILGDRLVRRRRASKRPEDFIAEVTSLDAGDLVVHVDHGIGRFVGLQTIEAAGAPHDCLELHYAESAKLYLPVENIELLSRYGSEEAGVQLDRLGGAGWQTRKARLKNRIREMAGELIKIAAARLLREAPRLTVAHGMYEEFCAGFPYDETEDQETVINARARRSRLRQADGPAGLRRCRLRQDRSGVARRLHRGDERQAGRGRGADHAARAPALQDVHASASARFPVKVAQASRLVPNAELKKVKEGLADGTGRHRGRHPRAARQGDQVQGSRPAGGRRGAAFRRRATRRRSRRCAPRCMCSR